MAKFSPRRVDAAPHRAAYTGVRRTTAPGPREARTNPSAPDRLTVGIAGLARPNSVVSLGPLSDKPIAFPPSASAGKALEQPHQPTLRTLRSREK